MTSIIEIIVSHIGDFNKVEIIEFNTFTGDLIEVDDPIITVESYKASMDIPCPIAGKIIELKVDIGDEVSAGDLITIL